MAYNICTRCEGRGDIKVDNNRVTCPNCRGSGVLDTEDKLTQTAFPNQPVPVAAIPVASTKRPRNALLWLLAIVATLGCIAAIWALLAIHGFQISISNSNVNGNTNINIIGARTKTPTMQSGEQTLTPGIGATATPQGTSAAVNTPTPSNGTPNPTATLGGPTPTPTNTPIVAPILNVMPTAIQGNLCVLGTQPLVIANQGGGTLQWTAKSNNTLIGVSPTSGATHVGQPSTVSVTLNSLILSGTITFGGNGGTQIVTVTC